MDAAAGDQPQPQAEERDTSVLERSLGGGTMERTLFALGRQVQPTTTRTNFPKDFNEHADEEEDEDEINQKL